MKNTSPHNIVCVAGLMLLGLVAAIYADQPSPGPERDQMQRDLRDSHEAERATHQAAGDDLRRQGALVARRIDDLGISLREYQRQVAQYLPRPVAFDGAEGYAAWAAGGRGGDTYTVTSMADDSTPGTLRHAIASADGPRTIEFEAGGTIGLASPLIIDRPCITIDGSTAPAPGITLAGQPVRITSTHDIILRHLRIRVGDTNAADREEGTGLNGEPVAAKKGRGLRNLAGADADGVAVHFSHDVILDHLSVSWAMDESIDIYHSTDVTVQHCLFAEGLRDAYHHYGPHGYAMLIAATPGSESRVSVHHNLIMHHEARNPAIQARDGSTLFLDFRNNVIYNCGEFAFHLWESPGHFAVNFVGNHYIAGADTRFTPRTFYGVAATPMHQRDNLMTLADGSERDMFADIASPAVPAWPMPAVNGGPLGIVTVGAMPRDATDERLVADLLARQGRIINSQVEAE